MPQDAFTLKFIANELASRLVGGKVSRINQPEKDELTFIIYTKTGTVKLEISAQAQNNRISLSDDEKPNPANAPNFCMLLRKHLQNAEITAVKQIGFERIVVFDFLCFSDFSDAQMQLYCEIMGKYSNVILVEKGVILGAMKTTALEENAKRILFAGAKYVLPAPQGKADPRDLDALRAALGCGGVTAGFISGNVAGIAASTAAEMVACYGQNITAEQLYEYVNGEAAPCVIYADGVPRDFKVRSCGTEQRPFASVLEAQKHYYSYVYTKKTFEAKKRKLESALSSRIKKCEKRLAQMDEKLFECEEAEEIKLKGELITANIYRIERGMSAFEAVNYYDEKGGTVQIALDKQLTPAQNAQKYYKKYAKMKRTVENLNVQKAQTEEQLRYLNSIQSSICAAELLIDLAETEEELTALGFLKTDGQKKKQKTAPSPFRTYECEGFKIIAGRNNVQNERLTKGLSSDDVWLHAQKYHSSHVGILTEGRSVPDGVLGVAAEICAHYSDGRDGCKIPVDYTYKKFVKKPPQKATGFVIYTDYKTVLVDPDGHEELKKDDR